MNSEMFLINPEDAPDREDDLPDKVIGLRVELIPCLAKNVVLEVDDRDNWRKVFRSTLTGKLWIEEYEVTGHGDRVVVYRRLGDRKGDKYERHQLKP